MYNASLQRPLLCGNIKLHTHTHTHTHTPHRTLPGGTGTHELPTGAPRSAINTTLRGPVNVKSCQGKVPAIFHLSFDYPSSRRELCPFRRVMRPGNTQRRTKTAVSTYVHTVVHDVGPPRRMPVAGRQAVSNPNLWVITTLLDIPQRVTSLVQDSVRR